MVMGAELLLTINRDSVTAINMLLSSPDVHQELFPKSKRACQVSSSSSFDESIRNIDVICHQIRLKWWKL